MIHVDGSGYVFFDFSTHPPARFFGKLVRAAKLLESTLQDGQRIGAFLEEQDRSNH
jgi:hypothetical protein